MSEIENIADFLIQYKDRPFIYIPNPGNCGDNLISYSTFSVLDDLGLDYKIGNYCDKYSNDLLIYGGGGNFVGLYRSCRRFLLNNKDSNEIVILPHTVKDETELLRSLGNNVTIICRERASYNYLTGLGTALNVMLSKDMAFYFKSPKSQIGTGVLNCFREDIEKTDIVLPNGNIDLSTYYMEPGRFYDVAVAAARSKSKCLELVHCLIDHIVPYAVVKTNRLHVAILSVLLGKEVVLHRNSYWKNFEVYDYSLRVFPNIRFEQ